MHGLRSTREAQINKIEVCGDAEPAILDVSAFPLSEFSKGEVKRAGVIIAGEMAWSDETAPVITEAFRIAHNWRDAHALPMRSIRQTVIHYMGRDKLDGITAARLKRMPAIRRKLRRVKLSLHQLQDLGGCRAILSSMEEVEKLTRRLREGERHELRAEDNYIASSKPDGYRSHHLMFNFRGKEPGPWDGKRIELQVRTRLQHAWATAVEGVGLFRGEDLKAHKGSEEWLLMFKLLSAEFAEAENCPVPEGCMEREARQRAIRELERKLDALTMLEKISHGVRGPQIALAQGYKPTHYLIRYDHAKKTVLVEPHNTPSYATSSYDSAELLDNNLLAERENIVLVEVDKIENLRAAYPNYFGDVQFFRDQLRAVTQGKAAIEYAAAPKEKRAKMDRELVSDPAWLRGSRFRGPSTRLKK